MTVTKSDVDDPNNKPRFDYAEVPVEDGYIRLVSLARRAEDMAHTEWRLRVVSLSAKSTSYHALSYRWGAPIIEAHPESTASEDNYCINMGNSEIGVTRNLFDFLAQVKDDETLLNKDFWIDAICIDQKNSDERNRQVSTMMANIYRKATHVIAWLGNSDTHTKLAFKYIEDQPLATHTRQQGSVDTGTGRAHWEAIGKVFDRTYWNRSWIIQELVLPEHITLRCGKHSADWLKLSEASHNISTGHLKHYFDSRNTAREVSSLMTSKTARNYEIPTILRATRSTMKHEHWATVLIYTLIRTRDCEATDPKDKVYSLLGLIQNRPDLGQIPELLRPHHEIKESPARAYVNAAIQLLRDCEDLLILSCAEGFRVVKLNGVDLPSWVPDWSVRRPLGLRVTGYKRYEADRLFASSYTTMSREEKLKRWPAVVDQRELTVTLRGVEIDKITFVAESKMEIIEGLPFPRLLEMLHMLPDEYEVTGEERLEAFWRTLIRNTGQDRVTPGPDSRLAQSFQTWFKERDHAQNMRDSFSSSPDPPEDGHNDQRSSSWDYGSQFAYGEYLRPFLTEKGFLGLGSQNLKEGDTVWLVPRSRVPLIFRQRGSGAAGTDYHCELIGGTYLHGLMDGQWIGEKVSKDDLKLDALLQTIVIY